MLHFLSMIVIEMSDIYLLQMEGYVLPDDRESGSLATAAQQLPEDEGNNGNGGKHTYKKMLGMCSEFLNAGTDTTTNALQWIMANLVKHPHIQSKIYDVLTSMLAF